MKPTPLAGDNADSPGPAAGNNGPQFRPATDDDRSALVRLLAEAFSHSAAPVPPAENIDLEDVCVVDVKGRVGGTARNVPLGQYFGGRVVASSAVCSVAVASHLRGRGIGRVLMHDLLRRSRDNGRVLSVLYPSIPGVYRRLGYELAGERIVWRTAIRPGSGAGNIAIDELDPNELDALRACYHTAAQQSTGLLERNDRWWRERILRVGDPATYRFCVRKAREIAGYIIFRKERASRDLPYYFDLVVSEAIWTTPEAGRALFAYPAAHAGLGVQMRWPGFAGEPWLFELNEDAARVDTAHPWMSRILDVSGALTARGYPSGSSGRVAFRVNDPILPENCTRYMIASDGHDVSVEQDVAGGEATIDIGALSSLYTGYAKARDLARAGRLTGASENDIATLDLFFSQPRPWLPEMF